MANAIVSIVASVLSYLATRGLDKALGKWVAYFTIAWEQSATISARHAWQSKIRELKLAMPGKYDEREKWRQHVKDQTQQ